MCGDRWIGVWCWTFIAAQGANNIYESGNNIFEGRTDTEGPMRNGYQAASRIFGGSDYEGNMAYGTADLMMSGWGLFRLIPKRILGDCIAISAPTKKSHLNKPENGS